LRGGRCPPEPSAPDPTPTITTLGLHGARDCRRYALQRAVAKPWQRRSKPPARGRRTQKRIRLKFPYEWQIGWRYTRAGKRTTGNGFISFIALVSM
jgi:hypothetical protein